MLAQITSSPPGQDKHHIEPGDNGTSQVYVIDDDDECVMVEDSEDGSQVDVAEIYSPPRVCKKVDGFHGIQW